MFRVMIVEDEMLVRLGLKNSIEWSRFGMTVVADVADGRAAWEIYLNDRPDLIITDLKIPALDGMGLIERIREQDKDTRIIILTSIEDFDLAKRAITLGVSDYILKMKMTEDEFEAALSKAQIELSRQKCSNQPGFGIEKRSKDILKEKFFKDYLFYNIYSSSELSEFVSEAELRLNPGHLIMCTMEIDHFANVQSRFNDTKGQLVKSSMLNILDEILSNYSRGEAIYDNDSNYMIIFSFHDLLSEQDMYKELHTILYNIRNALSTYLNVSVSFGISSLNNGYNALVKMYGETVRALEQKFFKGTGVFFSECNVDNSKAAAEKIALLGRQTRFIKMFSESGKREFISAIEMFKTIHPKNKDQIKLFFSNLLQVSFNLMYPIDEKSSILALRYSDKLRKSETLDEMIDNFNEFLSELADLAVKKDTLSKEVELAVRFIQNNYGQDINLPQVAEYVKLSPNYLGNLFKKKLKINFIEYLNQLRIEKAKELLRGTYLKSYEVAGRVGFTEYTYFCRVFKKIAGSSPNEFRKGFLKEWAKDLEDEDNWAV